MTTSFAGTALRLLAVNVTVTSCPRWSRPAGEMRSANRSLPASGEAITRCMSSASGAIARFVIEAPEPSMKKRTPEKSPTPSVTPTSAAAVRRGLRNRSRRTYLASIGGGELLLYDLAVAQAHRPAHPYSHVAIVGDNHQRRPQLGLRLKQEVDDDRRVLLVEGAGGFVGKDHARVVDERTRNRHTLPLTA